MKLPIKKKYFDMVLNDEKDIELRDAHLTLICETTGRVIRVEVDGVDIIKKEDIIDKKDRALFDDKNIIRFFIQKHKKTR